MNQVFEDLEVFSRDKDFGGETAKDGWADNVPVLCRVKMINEFPLIPNFEMLEHMIAERVSP